MAARKPPSVDRVERWLTEPNHPTPIRTDLAAYIAWRALTDVRAVAPHCPSGWLHRAAVTLAQDVLAGGA